MVTRQNIKTNFRDIKTRLLINVNGMPVEISRRTFKISKRTFQKRIPNKRTYIVLSLYYQRMRRRPVIPHDYSSKYQDELSRYQDELIYKGKWNAR